MHRITKRIDFCYGHRLLNYVGPCRYLHGHNAVAEITLESETLDARGMVVDFNDVKRTIKEWIDHEIDHRMILNKNDPALAMFRELNEPVFVLDTNPTAENIARVIFDYAKEKGLPVVEVRLWETVSSNAAYHE